MYKKGAGNDKQGKDAGNRTLCPYRNFSQAIITNNNLLFRERPRLSFNFTFIHTAEEVPQWVTSGIESCEGCLQTQFKHFGHVHSSSPHQLSP